MHTYQAPPPPPPPADERIKKAVRRGEVFHEPYDAARAVAYAQAFLKNGHDISRPPLLIAMFVGLLLLIVLQVVAGYLFLLVIPVGVFLAVMVYLAWFRAHRERVEQSLAANRQVAQR